MRVRSACRESSVIGMDKSLKSSKIVRPKNSPKAIGAGFAESNSISSDSDILVKRACNIKPNIEHISADDEFLAYCEAEDNYRNTIPHEILSGSESEPEASTPATTRREQRERRKLEKDRLSRTLFVGNLPAWITKKSLQTLFVRALRDSKVDPTNCKVESVRIRGAVPTNGGISSRARKRSAIQHEFAAGEKHTLIGFVVLTSKKGVPAALKLNGHFLKPKDGSTDTARHIRVDICNRQKHNNRNSLFVGNLPFSVNEEEVRNLFLPFGAIKGVRLIRDKGTGAVKGIGFVEFEDPCSVQLAIRQSSVNFVGLEGLKIGGRQLRVEAWKSIKKAKEVKGNLQKSLKQPKAPVLAVRIPTNIRGEAAKKEFVKRALQKRNKRKKRLDLPEGVVNKTKLKGKGVKIPKKGRIGGPRRASFV